MTRPLDLLVIGAGSGGVALSRRAALHGAKVAVIEGSRVGGTCVIRGCVPKKLLMYAAQYGDALQEARSYGWSLGEPAFDMARWARAKADEIARLEAVYRRLLADGGVTLVEGQARIVAPHTVAVGSQRIEAERIVVATGGHPARGVLPGLADCPTSDELLELAAIPPRAAVLGGGYIAVEFAGMLARLGSEVTLHYRNELPLRGFDDDLRRRAAEGLAAAGIVLRPGSMPQRVERDGAGWRLVMADGATVVTDWVLNALGRTPNTAGLGLDTIGVALDDDGAVRVDDDLATDVPGVYAVGDVTNRKNLTPVAIAEGRWLADRLYAPPGSPRVPLDTIATGVFTLPPIGTLGPTEAQCAQLGRPIDIYETDFKPMRQSFTGRAERVYMKLLVDQASDRVLGIHMIGTDAPEIVQSLAVALTAGATKADFDRTLAVHPTTAEEFVLLRSAARTVGAA